ncbi:hypothetical protein GCM10010495_08450 [Kitasatospora herbaricolor]|nr:hypothetical protein GCM10010495_08450 [Kitasatospora herbaricolor]
MQQPGVPGDREQVVAAEVGAVELAAEDLGHRAEGHGALGDPRMPQGGRGRPLGRYGGRRGVVVGPKAGEDARSLLRTRPGQCLGDDGGGVPGSVLARARRASRPARATDLKITAVSAGRSDAGLSSAW